MPTETVEQHFKTRLKPTSVQNFIQIDRWFISICSLRDSLFLVEVKILITFENFYSGLRLAALLEDTPIPRLRWRYQWHHRDERIPRILERVSILQGNTIFIPDH